MNEFNATDTWYKHAAENDMHAVSEMENKCDRMIRMIKRAANNSCCLCCDNCLACDALELLRDYGIEK